MAPLRIQTSNFSRQ